MIKFALENGVLVLKSGKDIVRFLPPITVSKNEITQGFQRFEDAILNLKD